MSNRRDTPTETPAAKTHAQDCAAAWEMFELLHRLWHEADNHRDKCPHLARLADEAFETLGRYNVDAQRWVLAVAH